MTWSNVPTSAILLLLALLSSLSARQRTESAGSLWLSDGYGLLLEDLGGTLQANELTSVSCMPSWSVKRVFNSNELSETVFVADDLTFRLFEGPTKDTKRLHMDGAASDISLHRTPDRPGLCDRTPVNSPQQDYAIFWQTFAE